MRILSVIGTRPETIKMAPLILALKSDAGFDAKVCVSGQHREMLDPLLSFFSIEADFDLAVMEPGQSLNRLTSKIVLGAEKVLSTFKPEVVLVHGDTTTAMAFSLAAFHNNVSVGHVEAGLRTHDLMRPWPEEMNRVFVDSVATYLFAPTERAAENLKAARKESRVFVTGNTVIDALQITTRKVLEQRCQDRMQEQFAGILKSGKRIVLVTGHRRENFGGGFERICKAIAKLSSRDDVEIVYPVHLNPNVKGPVEAALGNSKSIHLLPPLNYPEFIWMMNRSYIILTDSGGVQEEAPSLGKPVLVMRDVTERPEAVEAQTVRLVGTDAEKIVREIEGLLDDPKQYEGFRRRINPYGDGRASSRIVAALRGEPVEPFIAEQYAS